MSNEYEKAYNKYCIIETCNYKTNKPKYLRGVIKDFKKKEGVLIFLEYPKNLFSKCPLKTHYLSAENILRIQFPPSNF